MATQPTSKNERVTCSIPGPRNDYGHAKLLATLTQDGIWVWCKHCRDIHFVSRERCIAAWERGESMKCGQHESAVVE